MKLSAVIIAKNEETRIGDCLKSVAFCDEAVVVDSGSSDGTREAALKAGARVVERPFDHFEAQKNFAISRASGGWLLSVDADERVSPELAGEIRRAVDSDSAEFDAYRFCRPTFIFGKRMRFGVCRADRPVRLFRRGKAAFSGRVHEALSVSGAVGFLKGPLWHYSTPDVKSYFAKLGDYTDLETQKILCGGGHFSLLRLLVLPPARFVDQYLLKAGFLDAKAGFIFAVLGGYYEFVKCAKLWNKSDPLSDKMHTHLRGANRAPDRVRENH